MIGEYIAPSIKIIPNAIDYSDDIIELVLSLPMQAWRMSRVQDFNEEGEVGYANSVRVSREIGITPRPEAPAIFAELKETIWHHAHSYARENGFQFSHMENINLLEYAPNEGFFDRHHDTGPRTPRSMSALLYLNTVDQGGETWFDKFGLMIKPEQGKLVLFPANYPYSHQALPPVSSPKFVVVTWFGEMVDPRVFKEYYDETR